VVSGRGAKVAGPEEGYHSDVVPVGRWDVYGRHLLPGGPPAGSVVLVHGMVVAGMGVLPLAQRLAARGLAVHVPDLPGFGRSAKPRHALDVDGLADALAGWIGMSGLEGAGLLGNSFGTQVAAAAAARHPGMTGPLALMSPTIDRRFRRVWTRVLPAGRPGGLPAGGLLGWVQGQAVARFLPGDDRARNASLRQLILREYAAAGPVRALSTYRHALRDDLVRRMPSVSNPVLVVRGEYDRLVSPDWAALVTNAAGGSSVVIPGADHDAQFHLPDSVADAVTPHLIDATHSNRVCS
jgi:2-hydroxy-6-oxonona-2,4-dienedioate hydrolase